MGASNPKDVFTKSINNLMGKVTKRNNICEELATKQLRVANSLVRKNQYEGGLI